jgi:indole-3-glycerol phosphate synthase
MIASSTGDLLATIVAATRHGVQTRESARSRSQLERDLTRTPQGRRFVDALRASPAPRIIAECKRRSPSRGILREQYDPALHARQYAAAGAAAISVLTEPTFFDGSPDHLRAVRATVDIPVLRKDFIVTEYQVVEASWLGADAVLLIVGALDDVGLRTLLDTSREYGLAALLEIHDQSELGRAVDAGAQVIGVNSRNLRTLAVDHQVFERARGASVGGAVWIAESGIKDAADIARLSALGYDAFLVGERLISQPDPGGALKELRGQ